jgi:hypothetical protein
MNQVFAEFFLKSNTSYEMWARLTQKYEQNAAENLFV